MEPHKRFIRSNKPKLINILCTEASFILQHVKEELLADWEYTNLNANIQQNRRGVITQLLDKLRDKGDEHCKKFISLLGEDETLAKCPALKEILPPPTAPQVAARTPATDTPVQEAGLKTYVMTQSPRGLCVIINNMIFKKSGERKGSDIDADTLEQVFTWLGFTVECHNNKTVADMKKILQKCNAFGDCFICCMLSHGESEGILGCDDEVLTMEEILTPFKECPKLAGKPKLFFIQACRGDRFQDEVKLTTDTAGEVACELETDVRPFQTIPADADILIFMATVDKHYSLRDPEKGSWFIQPLCRQLREGAPRGDDIFTILTGVIDDVCKKEGLVKGQRARQVPDLFSRLRKKLVFPVSNS